MEIVKIKTVKLEENTRVLLNRAKAKLIEENPETQKITDDGTINIALSKFLGIDK